MAETTARGCRLARPRPDPAHWRPTRRQCPTPSPRSRPRTPSPRPGETPEAGRLDDSPGKTDSPTLAPPKQSALRPPSGDGPSASGSVPVRLDGVAWRPDHGRRASGAGVQIRRGSKGLRRSQGPDARQQSRAAEGPLRPIPEGGLVEVQTASFNRITPGVSTIDNVQKAWGPPKQVKSQGGIVVHLYQVDPFDHVEAFFSQGKVASIVIRLSRGFPADGVAQQLALSNLRPCMVSNVLGEILGQSYPERGVLFSFEPSPAPGKPSMKVAQIILEPVTGESFVLRAETNLESQPERASATWTTRRSSRRRTGGPIG